MFRQFWENHRREIISLSMPVAAILLIMRFALFLLPFLAGGAIFYIIYKRLSFIKYRRQILLVVFLLTVITGALWVGMLHNLDNLKDKQVKLAQSGNNSSAAQLPPELTNSDPTPAPTPQVTVAPSSSGVKVTPLTGGGESYTPKHHGRSPKFWRD